MTATVVSIAKVSDRVVNGPRQGPSAEEWNRMVNGPHQGQEAEPWNRVVNGPREEYEEVEQAA